MSKFATNDYFASFPTSAIPAKLTEMRKQAAKSCTSDCLLFLYGSCTLCDRFLSRRFESIEILSKDNFAYDYDRNYRDSALVARSFHHPNKPPKLDPAKQPSTTMPYQLPEPQAPACPFEHYDPNKHLPRSEVAHLLRPAPAHQCPPCPLEHLIDHRCPPPPSQAHSANPFLNGSFLSAMSPQKPAASNSFTFKRNIDDINSTPTLHEYVHTRYHHYRADHGAKVSTFTPKDVDKALAFFCYLFEVDKSAPVSFKDEETLPLAPPTNHDEVQLTRSVIFEPATPPTPQTKPLIPSFVDIIKPLHDLKITNGPHTATNSYENSSAPHTPRTVQSFSDNDEDNLATEPNAFALPEPSSDMPYSDVQISDEYDPKMTFNCVPPPVFEPRTKIPLSLLNRPQALPQAVTFSYALTTLELGQSTGTTLSSNGLPAKLPSIYNLEK